MCADMNEVDSVYKRMGDEIRRKVNKRMARNLMDDVFHEESNRICNKAVGEYMNCPEDDCHATRMEYKTTVRGMRKYVCPDCGAVELRS